MRRWLGLAVGGVLITLVGCSSNSHSSMNMNQGASQPALPVAALSTGTVTTPVPGARTITVDLGDYTVKLDNAKVAAGPVHLVVQNTGQRGHQLQVYPTAAVSGSGHGMQMGQGGVVQGAVGYLQLVPPGQTMALDVTLPAGSWEVACHLMDAENGKSFDHYDRGMKTTLTAS